MKQGSSNADVEQGVARCRVEYYVQCRGKTLQGACRIILLVHMIARLSRSGGGRVLGCRTTMKRATRGYGRVVVDRRGARSHSNDVLREMLMRKGSECVAHGEPNPDSKASSPDGMHDAVVASTSMGTSQAPGVVLAGC